MEDTKRFREALQDNVFKVKSESRRTPLGRVGQVSASLYHAELIKLPHAVTPEVQVTDPSSPDYGKFLFVVDYSSVDGDDVIL
jgi:hypothetical protein